MTARVVVCGGGISGLATAFEVVRLAREAGRGVSVRLLERERRAGGKVMTLRGDGYTVEAGPNGFLDSRQAALDLAGRAGIAERLVRADAGAARRFVWLGGRLRPIPTSPPALLGSTLLTWAGKARLLGEVLVAPRAPGGDDETLADFGRRRLGREATDRLLDPFLTGIFAGDMERTSVAAAFPRIVALEREHGGLIRGMVSSVRRHRREGGAAGGGPAGPGGVLTSFDGGMAVLTDTLAGRLGPDVVTTDAAVAAVRRSPDPAAGRWEVRLEGGEVLHADVVVSSAPAGAAARFLAGVGGDRLADALLGIPYVPVAVVALGYRTADLLRPPAGFGYLTPRSEGRRVLGMLWSHCIFPGLRAPDGQALLHALVGGARSPDLAALDDAALQDLVRGEVREVLGERDGGAGPAFSKVVRWADAIPQYVVGHLARVAEIEAAAARNPGLLIGGNALRGVSLAECAADALALAQRAMTLLPPA